MKKWYKNPLVIGLILASMGWFSWITRSAILSEGKADNSSVLLTRQELGQLCTGLSEIKEALKTHETNQNIQIEKIYSLLVQIAGGNRTSLKKYEAVGKDIGKDNKELFKN